MTVVALGIAALLAPACSSTRATDAAAPTLTIVAPFLDSPIADRMPHPFDRPLDKVKVAVLDRINRDRLAAGLGTVLWDERASRVADDFCAAQIREGTSGHFLTNGFPPYARTSFAGVFGMEYENSVTWRTTATSFDETATELALEAHDGMLAERPPNDGHRRTILDPAVTHVGVGYALTGGSFRMAQEFLTRHLEWIEVERLTGRPIVSVRGAPIEGRRLLFVTIGWEPPPERLARDEASRRTSYSYPPTLYAFVDEGNLRLKVAGAVTFDRIRFTGPREFSFRFGADRPGLWTMEFYTIGAKEPRPIQGAAVSVWFDEPSRAGEPGSSP